MATVRSGGLFTNEVKSRICTQVSPHCELCGELDGMTHRTIQCSASERIRTENGWEHLKDVPRHCLVYGLFARPEAQDGYQKAFDEIRINDLCMLPCGDQPDHIFRDGSCTQPHPSKKSERRAAYGVRLAIPNSHEGRLLAAGVFPGRKQTAFRAELWAFMMAMSIFTNSIIYTDCRGVYNGILRLQKHGWSELSWLSSPDLDLWRGAWSILSHPGRRLGVEWVKSHRNISSARNAKETWQIYHNALTDKAASVGANLLPDWIQPVWEELVTQNAANAKLRNEVLSYLKAIWAKRAATENS